jgi:ribosomal protein L31
MTEIEFDCTTSKNLSAGSTVVHDACVIDIVSVIDSSHVSVKVYPLYEGRIDLILVEGQETNFRDFQVPFRITATSIFYGST